MNCDNQMVVMFPTLYFEQNTSLVFNSVFYLFQERTKHIENWVQNSAQIAAQPAGRRAKSQTREGQSEGAFNIDPMSTHGGRYGPGKIHNLVSI